MTETVTHKTFQAVLIVVCLILMGGGISLLSGATAQVNGMPYAGYSHETGLMGGGFLIYRVPTDSLHKDRFSIITNGIYTWHKQLLLVGSMRVRNPEAGTVTGFDIIGRDWPSDYWQMGNAVAQDEHIRYEYSRLLLRLTHERRLWSHLSPGVLLEGRWDEQRFPSPLDGRKSWKYRYASGGASLRFDTANAEEYPTQGVRYLAAVKYYTDFYQKDGAVDADASVRAASWHNMNSFVYKQVELNHYLSPLKGVVVASQSAFERLEGSAPELYYPQLSDRLRAYDSGRFHDKCLLAQRLELRLVPRSILRPEMRDEGFASRWGVVLFTEAGQVAPVMSAFAWERNHWSNGFGLRYAIEPKQRINFRLDFCFGDDVTNVIFQAREVF